MASPATNYTHHRLPQIVHHGSYAASPATNPINTTISHGIHTFYGSPQIKNGIVGHRSYVISLATDHTQQPTTRNGKQQCDKTRIGTDSTHHFWSPILCYDALDCSNLSQSLFVLLQLDYLSKINSKCLFIRQPRCQKALQKLPSNDRD